MDTRAKAVQCACEKHEMSTRDEHETSMPGMSMTVWHIPGTRTARGAAGRALQTALAAQISISRGWGLTVWRMDEPGSEGLKGAMAP